MRSATKSFRRRNGSVIVLVLGTIIMVAGLLTRFVTETGTDLIAASRMSDGTMLRREAYSALETTLAVLAEFQGSDGALYSPAQGWSDPIGYAGGSLPEGLKVAVAFSDETGKLSLPNASPEAIERLLVFCGADPAKSRQAAETLFLWTSRDQGTGGGTGSNPKRPLRAFAEMASIPILRDLVTNSQGQPNDVWAKITQAVSLYRSSSTNLNSAEPAVLYSLGWPEERIAALGSARMSDHRTGYVQSLDEFALSGGMGPASTGLGTQIEVLRISVTVSSAGAAHRLEAVVATRPAGGDLGYPFQILEFQENPAVLAVAP